MFLNRNNGKIEEPRAAFTPYGEIFYLYNQITGGNTKHPGQANNQNGVKAKKKKKATQTEDDKCDIEGRGRKHACGDS